MSTKYTMTDAAAKRIAITLVKDAARMNYQAIVRAVREEGFSNPKRQVPELISALSDITGYDDLAVAIGVESAREAARANEQMEQVRSGFMALGLAFEDDIKPEAMRNL